MSKPINRASAESSSGLSVSTLAMLGACCGLFDLCTDQDLMSLSFQGREPFLDWLGWQPTDVCKIRKAFLDWIRPAMSGETATAGYLADPCADPNGVEYGVCEFELEDFGRLRRAGPVRDITKNAMRLCEAQPRYRLDGSLITDQREWDIRVTLEVIMQDLKRMIITGNATTAGQFDGLQRLIKTGYTDPAGRRCASMDSIIVDWNGNTLAGGAGITWNGAAIAATWDFIDVLLAVFRRIRQRISWAPALAAQGLRVGDIVLMMPTFMTRCLLDSFTCWSVCANAVIDTYEARQFRQQLNGGMFGDGRIYLDGFEIPLLAYDWGTINGPTTADIYLLTGRVGNIRTLNGQFNDMRSVPGSYPGGVEYAYTDGGRILTWTNRDHTCVQQIVEMQPRILAWAPWAQARFQDVVCAQPGGPLSPDPLETSFFPETSFSVAACP